MLVDIDYLLAVKKRLSQINNEDINNIKWIKDGKEVEFSKEDTEKWEFIGLANKDIITVFPYTEVKKKGNKDD